MRRRGNTTITLIQLLVSEGERGVGRNGEEVWQYNYLINPGRSMLQDSTRRCSNTTTVYCTKDVLLVVRWDRGLKKNQHPSDPATQWS